MSAEQLQGGYDARFAPLLAAAEDRHFWFVARNQVIAALVEGIEPALSSGYRVLEIGCGTGNTLRVLERLCPRGFVAGMDFQREGLTHARRRVRCPLLQGDMRAVPFRSNVRFDVVGMFDVLEHLDDDRGALTAVRDLLRPDGVLLLTVPAAPELWSRFDVAAGHCRRYRAPDLASRLTSAGFTVEYLSPFMTALYPVAWLVRVARQRFGRTHDPFDATTDELRIVPGVNAVMRWALLREVRFVRHRRVLPFGSSLVAVARAPAGRA